MTTATLESIKAFEAKNYDHLLGTPGFSDKLLTNHFKLYQGYVTNTNTVSHKLKEMDTKASPPTPEYSELKRRFGWEFNGMRLHEYYFDNMTKETGKVPGAKFSEAVTQAFGSIDRWKDDFLSTGSLRGIGWVVLYKDPQSGRIFNTWVDEHALGHLAGCTPLLVLDVFEHAFITDYGLDRKSYLNAFYSAINWETVSKRLVS